MKHLGDENCVTFPDVEWSDNGGTNEESLAEYLVAFGKQFYDKLVMLIDRVSIISIELSCPLTEGG